MAELSKEETLQEALIGWILAGGNCEDLIRQVDLFFEGVEEFETFADGGDRAAQLDWVRAGLMIVGARARSVDRAGGFPEVSPAEKRRAALRQEAPCVMVELRDGLVESVRASAPVNVTVWSRDEVREGLVPTVLLEMPAQPVQVLHEESVLQAFPEQKVVGGATLYLLRVDGKVRYDRQGRPIYCSVPDAL